MTKYDFIAIEGNIGAGKTTLAAKLAGEINSPLIKEQFEDNPFLQGFYSDASRYAFQTELTFLADRVEQLKKTVRHGKKAVSDYFLEKSLVFAGVNLPQDEYFLFRRLFGMLTSNLPSPDLLVFINSRTEHLKDNIKRRGRSYEQNISHQYLERITSAYLRYFEREPKMPVLWIDTAGHDFVKNPDAIKTIISLLGNEYPAGITKVLAE